MASELRPTVVFKFVFEEVVCSLGYRSSSMVVCNFVSIVNLYCNFYGYIKEVYFQFVEYGVILDVIVQLEAKLES